MGGPCPGMFKTDSASTRRAFGRQGTGPIPHAGSETGTETPAPRRASVVVAVMAIPLLAGPGCRVGPQTSCAPSRRPPPPGRRPNTRWWRTEPTDASRWWEVFKRSPPSLGSLIWRTRRNLSLRAAGLRVLEAPGPARNHHRQTSFPQQTGADRFPTTRTRAQREHTAIPIIWRTRCETAGKLASMPAGSWTSGASSAARSRLRTPTCWRQ